MRGFSSLLVGRALWLHVRRPQPIWGLAPVSASLLRPVLVLGQLGKLRLPSVYILDCSPLRVWFLAP